MSDSDQKAEKIAWRRARFSTVMALIFVVSQTASFPADRTPLRMVETVHMLAWLVWAGGLLTFLFVGGKLFADRHVRKLLDDESTVEHRRDALVWGFWAAFAIAAILYTASFFEPLTAREALRPVITFAVAAALLRFGTLERKALKTQ